MRVLRDGEALNGGTPQVWGLSAPIPRPRRREILRVGKLPRSPWRGGLENMPDIDDNDGAARAPYVRVTQSQDCVTLVHNLEIAQMPRLRGTYISDVLVPYV